MQELKDIKPFINSSDWMYYGFIAFVVIVSLLAFAIVYKVFYIWWSSRKTDKRKMYLKLLKSLDKSDSKDFAYKATFYGRNLINDRRSKEIFSQLEEMLYKYKYKKDVLPIDDETFKYFRLFIEVVDV